MSQNNLAGGNSAFSYVQERGRLRIGYKERSAG
jgi:hypothetical protein